MRGDLHRKLVAGFQSLFGRLAHSYSGGSAGDDDCACGQGRALGKEADKLWNSEDEVAVTKLVTLHVYNVASCDMSYSSGQSCRTFPFFEPRM